MISCNVFFLATGGHRNYLYIISLAASVLLYFYCEYTLKIHNLWKNQKRKKKNVASSMFQEA